MSAVFPVDDDPRWRSHVATAGQVTFPIPYVFQDTADITIQKIAPDGAVTPLVYPTDYAISGAGNIAGGNYTLVVPAQAGERYRSIGTAVGARTSSIVRSGRYSSKATDDDLDRALIRDLELRRDVDRSLQMPLGADPLPKDHFPLADGNGSMKDGGSAADIANAQQNAEIATDAAARGQIFAAMLSADKIKFPTVPALVADEMMSYAPGAGLVEVGPGDVLEAAGFRYRVAASGAADQDLTSAGGVKLNAIVRGALDVAQLGALGAGDETAIFAKAAALVGAFGTIDAPDEYTVGDLQLYNTSINGKRLIRKPGATAILNLGNHVPGWHFPVIRGVHFKGAADKSDLTTAGIGVNFFAPTSPEYAGRWNLQNCFFQFLAYAIRGRYGNIGNVYDHVSGQSCYVGYYGRGNDTGAGDMMQPGCQIFNFGEWSDCSLAFVIEGGGAPNGQNVWNQTVIESNEIGVLAKNYQQAWVPLTFNGVWFEGNGQDPDPVLAPDGQSYPGCDTYFLNVAASLFNGCSIWKHQFHNSAGIMDGCTFSASTEITNVGSTVRATNAVTIGMQGQPVLVESYINAQREAGGLADAIWMPPRDNVVNVAPYRGAVVLARKHDDAGGGNFTGTVNVPWVSTTSGGSLYDRCAEFTLPAGATISLGNFNIEQGLTAVYSVEARRLTGPQPNISFTGGASVCGDLGKILRDSSSWFTAGGIARAASDRNAVSLYITNPSATEPLSMRLGCVQAVKFFSVGDAVAYYNGRHFPKATV